MSSELTFIMNEPGKSLRDRFGVLLGEDTRFFDCLVGYFFISGFYKLYPALEKVEKIRILVGLQTDRAAYVLLQRAKEQGDLVLQSHASTKERVTKVLLTELEKSPDSAEIETSVYLASLIAEKVESDVLLFTGSSDESVRKEVIANFDAKAFQPKNQCRILVATEVLSEGVNLHRSNIVINYDIPWNPTRLIQRVGRVNRVDTTFDTIHTYNFFPTEESNDVIKLKEAAEAKIHAFIEMLGADARLLTEGEEIKSHDLFAKLTSKKTITGEDEEEESELEFLTEIREVRDKQPELFQRIKRLPKKARSTKHAGAENEAGAKEFPVLLTYFRQGRLDKFFLAGPGGSPARELDFFASAKVLKPADTSEKRQNIPKDFYALLDKNKAAFETATSPDLDDAIPKHKGGANDAYVLKRLKAKEIKRYHGFTDDDELYIRQVIQLLIDGALPRPTTKKVAEALKKEIEPLKVLGILRRDIPSQFFQATRAQAAHHALSPREVILSSYLLKAA